MTSASLVLLPCSGLSARGQLTRRTSQMLREQINGLKIVDLVPLMAGIPEEVEAVKKARAVVGFAGCQHRCDLDVCLKIRGKAPEHEFVIENILRNEVRDIKELSHEEFESVALQITSHLIGKLSIL